MTWMNVLGTRLIDWIIGGLIAALSLIVLYLVGVFDSSIKKYILNSMEAHIIGGYSGGKHPDGNYQYISTCETNELLIGGTCLVRRGGGSMQNTGLEPGQKPTSYRCVFAQTSADFEGEAHAVCLRSR